MISLRFRRLIAFLFPIAVVFIARSADAQVHGDMAVYGGISQRVIAGPSGGGALPGPMVGLEGHVAVVPLLRLGAYVQGEIAPTNDAVAAKKMIGGGVHAKVILPWPRGKWSAWFAVGLGYVGAYSPSYSQTIFAPSPVGTLTQSPASVEGAGGGFVEIPLSFGVARKLRKPFVVFAELSGRFGFAFSGSLYGDGGGRTATFTNSGVPATIDSNGTDVFAVTLALGIGFDQ